MDEKKEVRYDVEREKITEEQIIREEAALYGVKKPGEYTIEDYYALPDDVRVELIDGVLYDMAAPSYIHQYLSSEIEYKLKDYVVRKKGKCHVLHAPLDIQLDCDDKTMVQPDIIILCDKTKAIRRGIYGAPDFIVEILSPSTSRKDTIIKLRKYKEAGVREYWMVDPDGKRIVVYDWDHDGIPKVYGFDAKVPVGIFGGECEIDFLEIYEQVKWMYEET